MSSYIRDPWQGNAFAQRKAIRDATGPKSILKKTSKYATAQEPRNLNLEASRAVLFEPSSNIERFLLATSFSPPRGQAHSSSLFGSIHPDYYEVDDEPAHLTLPSPTSEIFRMSPLQDQAREVNKSSKNIHKGGEAPAASATQITEAAEKGLQSSLARDDSPRTQPRRTARYKYENPSARATFSTISDSGNRASQSTQSGKIHSQAATEVPQATTPPPPIQTPPQPELASNPAYWGQFCPLPPGITSSIPPSSTMTLHQTEPQLQATNSSTPPPPPTKSSAPYNNNNKGQSTNKQATAPCPTVISALAALQTQIQANHRALLAEVESVGRRVARMDGRVRSLDREISRVREEVRAVMDALDGFEIASSDEEDGEKETEGSGEKEGGWI